MTDEQLQDLFAGMQRHLEGTIKEGSRRTDEKLSAMEERLIQHSNQRAEQIETKLLKAFHGWSRSMEVGVRGLSAQVKGFDERLALAEDRLSTLERNNLEA